MEIRLTAAQYQTLIKLVYLGQWMIEGSREEEANLKDYDALASYIYSYAPLFGFKNLVDFDEAEGEYYPSDEFDDLMEEIIARYEESSFWDQLVVRLAERDLLREYGENGIKKMEWKEIEEKRGALIKKYLREIEEHGLDNLIIERIS